MGFLLGLRRLVACAFLQRVSFADRGLLLACSSLLVGEPRVAEIRL